MPQIDQEQLIKRYKNLPPDLKDAMFSEEVTDKIMNISNKYGLYVDKMGDLGNEIGRVMLGLTHPKDFIKNLSERLGVDAEKAKSIAKDVNEQIFGPVRESLKKLHKIGEEEPSEVKPPTVEKPTIKEEIKPLAQEIQQPISEVKPLVEPPIVESPIIEQKPAEEKEIVEIGIQRAPKQYREIKEEVEQAKKEEKYPGGTDPYRETL